MTDEEKFQVIRFLLALAHYDGQVSNKEKNVINERIPYIKLSADQKSILAHELRYAVDPMEIFEGLSLRAKRQCLESGRILIHASYADESEKNLLKSLTESHLSTIDVDFEHKEARRQIDLIKENRQLKKKNQLWRALAHWSFFT